MTLPELLAVAAEMQASDVHLTAGQPPLVRVFGDLQRLEAYPVLCSADIEQMVRRHLTDSQQEQFEKTSELDFSSDIHDVARVRGNVFRQRGGVAAVFRLIPELIPSIDDLGLPGTVAEFARLPRGLVLVTGPTESGKSTTLAAMVDIVNSEQRSHILTIEDPIEYVHTHKMGVVNQREIRADTTSFALALRAALREDPDVVLIGEMRDRETVEAALRIAETGHLTLATLHTNSAIQTIHRIIDLFPAHARAHVRGQLSFVIEGIVCQILAPRADGQGRVAAVEVLVPTSGVRHLIREDKLHQVHSAMQSAPDTVGMQTMNQALLILYRSGQITRDDALAGSSNREEIEAMISPSPCAGRCRPVCATTTGTSARRAASAHVALRHRPCRRRLRSRAGREPGRRSAVSVSQRRSTRLSLRSAAMKYWSPRSTR